MDIAYGSIRRSIRRVAVIILSIAFAAGCGSTDTPDLDTPDTRINALPIAPPRSDGRLIVDQIYLPHDRYLHGLLADATHESIDGGQRAAWQANELQVYRLNAVELSRFYQVIDEGSSMRRNRHSVADHHLLLETTPHTGETFAMDWAAKPGLDQTMPLPAGRTRWLGDVRFIGNTATISMTPQHHWVKSSLLPRTPKEKEFDGRIFEELTLTAELPDNTYLVIIWHRPNRDELERKELQLSPAAETESGDANFTNERNEPSPPNEPNTPTDTGDGAASDDTGTQDNANSSPQPEINPLPDTAESTTGEAKEDEELFPLKWPDPLPRLGRLLLTGSRAGKQLQLVLVIHSPQRSSTNDNSPAPREPVSPTP